MSSWSHVTEGAAWRPPTAQVHNAMLDAAKENRNRIVVYEDVPAPKQWTVPLNCLNESGATLERGDCVAVSALKYQPTDSNIRPWEAPILVGSSPAWPDDSGRLAIAQGTISDNKIGLVSMSGIVIARVEVLATTHRWVWFSDDASHPLKTGTGGQCKIIGTTPAVGVDKYVLVNLDKQQPLWRFKYGGSSYDPSGDVDYKLVHLDGTDANQAFAIEDPLDYFDRITEADHAGHVMWIDDKFHPAGATC